MRLTTLNTTLAYQDGAFSVGAWDTDVGGGAEWDGLMDEARFTTTLHSAAWQDAEYANQNSPTSFYSVGSTTVSTSSASYLGLFAYTSIGNISSTSDSGDYTYGETGTTNPSAATDIDGVSLTYDQNGNLLTHGSSTYQWDYRNRLIESGDGTASTTYGYDYSGQRVFKTAGATTTVYASQYHETDGTTPTKYIYAGSDLVATVEGTGTTTINYVHSDHLGSTNVVTDENANVMQTLDYYPFGSERINTGATDSQRTYIGEFHDSETDLSYLNARYYEGSRGQFLSQDPSFLDIGGPGFEQNYGRTLQMHLMNPQALNSYSYALNNPIRYSDPEGEIVPLLALGALAFYGGYSAGTDLYEGYTSGDNGQFAWGAVGAAGSLIPGGGAVKGGVALADDAVRAGVATARNYRDVFQKTFGQLNTNIQVHHTLPQKYESLFKQIGTNIHDLKHLQGVPVEIHKKINAAWRTWDKAQKGDITPQKVKDFAKQIDKQFGKYYKDKKK